MFRTISSSIIEIGYFGVFSLTKDECEQFSTLKYREKSFVTHINHAILINILRTISVLEDIILSDRVLRYFNMPYMFFIPSG